MSLDQRDDFSQFDAVLNGSDHNALDWTDGLEHERARQLLSELSDESCCRLVAFGLLAVLARPIACRVCLLPAGIGAISRHPIPTLPLLMINRGWQI